MLRRIAIYALLVRLEIEPSGRFYGFDRHILRPLNPLALSPSAAPSPLEGAFAKLLTFCVVFSGSFFGQSSDNELLCKHALAPLLEDSLSFWITGCRRIVVLLGYYFFASSHNALGSPQKGSAFNIVQDAVHLEANLVAKQTSGCHASQR